MLCRQSFHFDWQNNLTDGVLCDQNLLVRQLLKEKYNRRKINTIPVRTSYFQNELVNETKSKICGYNDLAKARSRYWEVVQKRI